mgnify:CR=1 FL=1
MIQNGFGPFSEELNGYSLFERKIAIFAEIGRGSAGKGRDFVLMLWSLRGGRRAMAAGIFINNLPTSDCPLVGE